MQPDAFTRTRRTRLLVLGAFGLVGAVWMAMRGLPFLYMVALSLIMFGFAIVPVRGGQGTASSASIEKAIRKSATRQTRGPAEDKP